MGRSGLKAVSVAGARSGDGGLYGIRKEDRCAVQALSAMKRRWSDCRSDKWPLLGF